ncbi:hypothetical protein SDC9_163221 [bioreactor metagenome]|uniref:ribonucleoside-diphosphate reductase n=1 Tax=bioreactor metagenome TaxID=1076179 RepID=A0A645FN87_9ZZZZ
MKFNYKTQNVCSKSVSFDYNDGIITNIKFKDGCNGNLKLISQMMDGWNWEKITKQCTGNTCGTNSTSCADQLTRAILAAQRAESRG